MCETERDEGRKGGREREIYIMSVKVTAKRKPVLTALVTSRLYDER